MSEPRGALYYPFIHLRDPEWIKATLLCFPRIYRMVPPKFEINDPDETRPFTTLEGPKGARFVDKYDLDKPFLQTVQKKFRERLAHDITTRGDTFRHSLMRRSAQQTAGRTDAFQIHRSKINDLLLEFLLSKGLAWPPDNPNRGGEASWVALHPKLGEAVMSTLAAAIAKEGGVQNRHVR